MQFKPPLHTGTRLASWLLSFASFPEAFGAVSVCYCAMLTMPAAREKELPGGARHCRVSKETHVVSRLCGRLCLRGKRGNGASLAESCTSCWWRLASFILLFWLHLQMHEQQCPFASVMCQYCEMDLIRDQVSRPTWAVQRKFLLKP